MTASARPQRADEFVRKYWPHESDLPKHERLKQAFTQSISDGFWAVGARLPTEAELVASTACSLGTIQRALRELASDGVVERKRGSGSVVADFRSPIQQPWHISYFDPREGATGFLPVFTTVVRRTVSKRPGPWSVPLGQQGDEVVRIDRIFSVNEEFRIYSCFWAMASRFPDLLDGPKTALNGQNLKILIASKYRTPVRRVRQRLRWEVPPASVASQSDCPAGEPATVLNFIAQTLNGDTLYYQDFYVPRNPYQLDLGTAVT